MSIKTYHKKFAHMIVNWYVGDFKSLTFGQITHGKLQYLGGTTITNHRQDVGTYE